MKRTSHTTHKHKHRKAIEGLTPADIVEQMAEDARGKNVRTVRRGSGKSQDAVLPKALERSPGGSGEGRVLPAAPGDDPGRSGDTGGNSFPDVRQEAGSQLSRVLKRMLGETPPAELIEVEGVGRLATNAEALAAVVMREALNGRQWAVELVRDQTEGKPVRSAQINNNEAEIEDQLDRVSAAALNKLAKGK